MEAPGLFSHQEHGRWDWTITKQLFSILYMRSASDDRTARAIIRDEALRLFAVPGRTR